MRNPKWSRDEIILCLDLYLNHDGRHIQKNAPEIIELSEILGKLPIIPNNLQYEKFRNANGVYMKLNNFKAFDSEYNGKGLAGGSKLDELIFNEFYTSKPLLSEVAKNIK